MPVNKLIETVISEEKFEWYMKLLDKSYDECIVLLKQKYGEVRDNYFKEKSYDRFLNGEIKKISAGNYSRAKEGLECHHIYENEYIKVSDQEVIKEFDYPYELQKKEHLVYCDICEHFILHTLIIKETKGEFGVGGNEVYLKPKINDWFIQCKIPKPEWMKECIRRVSLPPYQARYLLRKSEGMLKEINDKKRKEYEIESNQRLKEYRAKQNNMSLEEYEDFLKKEGEKEKNRAIQKELEKKNEFDREYPNLYKLNVTHKTSRKKILKLLYDHKYKEVYLDLKTFSSDMLSIVRQDLLKTLNDIEV